MRRAGAGPVPVFRTEHSMGSLKGTKTNTKKNGTKTTVLLVIVLVIGLGILLYPTFADWWNSLYQNRAINTYVETVANMDEEENERLLAEAEAYNKELLSKPNRFLMTEEDRKEYESVLDVSGSGIMGYIEIPSIDVKLPIYHGTDDKVLQTATGHIESTSLPVGGIGTHAAISGHRGLPSARLFTDLDKMEYGDTFLIQVLDRTLKYEVDRIRIVKPADLTELEIDPEKDLFTLVTCTPYGVNTDRLLVRGKRVDDSETNIDVKAEGMQFNPLIIAPLVAAPILLVLLILVLITTGRNRENNLPLRVDKERRDKLIRKNRHADGEAAKRTDSRQDTDKNTKE